MRLLVAVILLVLAGAATAQDYEREQRWADQILPALMVGDAVWLQQKEGHKFLTLYTEAKNARGAVIVAHGRGWSPDYELYGTLRTKIAEAGLHHARDSAAGARRRRQDRRLHPDLPGRARAFSAGRRLSQEQGLQEHRDRVAQPGRHDGQSVSDQHRRQDGQGVGVHRHHQRAGGDVPHQDPGPRRVRQQGLGDHAGRCLRTQETDHEDQRLGSDRRARRVAFLRGPGRRSDAHRRHLPRSGVPQRQRAARPPGAEARRRGLQSP